MPLSRLVYISENQIAGLGGSQMRELSTILSASNRNNKAAGVTGALAFDELWFLQALEGERKAVWSIFERIRYDERHAQIEIVELVDIPHRLFGNWWMGFAARCAATEPVFQPFLVDGLLRADAMSAADILSLMQRLAKLGLHREIAARAA